MKYFLFIIALFLNHSINASELSFFGEIRERYEYLDGMNKKTYGESSLDKSGNKLGSSNDNLLVQKITFGFLYKQNNNLTWKLSGYDSRVFGWSLDNDNFVKNKNTPHQYTMNSHEEFFELYDASLNIKNFFHQNLDLTIGRQKMHYGDKRIFGPGGWGNSVGWLWDAVKLSYKNDNDFVDIFYGQTKAKNPHSFSLIDKHVFEGLGFYSHFQTTQNGAIEPFYVYKNSIIPAVSGNDLNYAKTNNFGIRVYEKDYNSFNYDLTYTKQVGSYGVKDVDTYAYVLKAGYKFKSINFTPNLGFGRIFASGDDNLNDNTIKSYTRPFGGTDGSLYGRMDIMFWSNLIDNEITLELKPTSDSTLLLSYHNFNLENPNDTWSYYKYKNATGLNDTHLGDEYDLTYKYNYSKNLKLQFIYAYFNAGNFVKNSVEDNDASRVFLELTYKFTI